VFFRNFTRSGQWGRFTANNGVLRSTDGSTLSVPVTAPLEGTTLKGDGWSATLNSGWVVRPAARPSSFTIVERTNFRYLIAHLLIERHAKERHDRLK